jgi:tRNA G18 (ribose-2'-O)-methylase SpoU
LPEIVRIGDADDPRIAAYRDIRERDLVGRDGMFIAEGEVVLRVLLTRSRHQAVSVLLAEKRLAGLEPLLAALPGSVPVYVANQDILERVAGFPLHRGILALGRYAPTPALDELLADREARACVVALFGIANHDNIGGIFRNAAAFGADAVLLDGGCCDPLYRKAIRVSVGAALTMPFARLPHGTDLVGLLTGHGFQAIGLSPCRGAAHFRDAAAAPRRPAARGGRAGPAAGGAFPDFDSPHSYGSGIRFAQCRHCKRNRTAPSGLSPRASL